MEALKLRHQRETKLDPGEVPREVTDADRAAFAKVTTISLTDEQKARVATPGQTYPKQRHVLALHWHPEFVPMDVIVQRIEAMFPNRESELIIPTQHNVLLEYDGFAGVEIDCYSPSFDLKVQLLVHFAAEKVREASVLKAMLAHTHKYRASQLHEFIDSILNEGWSERVDKAAAKTGASEELVQFVRVQVAKIKTLIDEHEAEIPPDMLKNKLLRNFFHTLRGRYDDEVVSHAQYFLHAIKQIVKRNFTLTYFYQTEEIIEEIRSLGGGIVIPHPEQFWPILLADYDVDGIEVWNPQSRQYTDFLIHCVNRQNKSLRPGKRPVLITMGDDTHFGEKVLDPEHQDPEKSARELGVQAAWDDLSIRKSLIVANTDRKRLIAEYKARLLG